MNQKKVVIFDIDGILADISHRYEHYTHICNCFFNIRESYHVDELLMKNYEYYKLFKVRGYPIYIFTSRSEEYKKETTLWLAKNNIIYNLLEMRTTGDYKPAYKVKEEYLLRNFGERPDQEIKAVFEDEIGCIEMYRSYGLQVYDCKPKPKQLKINNLRQLEFRLFVYN